MRVLLVVARIGQIVRVPEFHQPRIFNPAVFLVLGFWRKDGLRMPNEVDALVAFGIAEA